MSSRDQDLSRLLHVSSAGRSAPVTEHAAALGQVISALRRTSESDIEASARLQLAASILARKADLYVLAEHFAQLAALSSADERTDPRLSTAVAIELANVAICRGACDRAQEHLARADESVLAEQPVRRAQRHQPNAFLLYECGDSRTALEL
ncbi:MAG: hypothetical protein JSV80_00085 [Acidobacteriota bacterium]|nr:MAG: hypothetical protein JSV80_00085 [Acidobacteriota bacterium]